jgi:hypothetical protein
VDGWSQYSVGPEFLGKNVEHFTFLPSDEQFDQFIQLVGRTLASVVRIAKIRVFVVGLQCRIVPIVIPGPMPSEQVEDLRNAVKRRLGIEGATVFADTPIGGHLAIQFYLSTMLLKCFCETLGLDPITVDAWPDDDLLRTRFKNPELISGLFGRILSSEKIEPDGAMHHISYLGFNIPSSTPSEVSAISALHDLVATGQMECIAAVWEVAIAGQQKTVNPDGVTFDFLCGQLPHIPVDYVSLALDLGCDLGVLVAKTTEVHHETYGLVVCRLYERGEPSPSAPRILSDSGTSSTHEFIRTPAAQYRSTLEAHGLLGSSTYQHFVGTVLIQCVLLETCGSRMNS